MTFHRHGIMPKDVLLRPDGWISYDTLVRELIAQGVTRDELPAHTGLLPAEIDSIVERLAAASSASRR